ncbi:MAG TPA: glutamate-cysteine ligase family protein [Casimicrobiaceae bacterium]|nr:glutamate-cysteine ligase family protein [Casimicrobiaceae bacterium]
MTARWTIPAFSGYGIELEYMIVDQGSLDVRPVAGDLLRSFAGGVDAADVEHGALGWSNELTSHVIELKNIAPTPALSMLSSDFQNEIRYANRALEPMSARLMPTGMHPWMQPAVETVLWTKQYGEIYQAYDRIFDCRRHGWANVQSTHINLPFTDDVQFARLHAAVRLLLALAPALAASSPVADGHDSGLLDFRVEAYRWNARRAPSVVGKVIPETVVDRRDYERRILDPMYREIQPHDPAGVLRHEWLNSRGAIPRFERNAIEVRLVDTQEHPGVDVAIAAAFAAAARSLYFEAWSTLWQQQAVPTDTLLHVLLACARTAEQAVIDDPQFLDVLGMKPRRCTAAEIWDHLLGKMTAINSWWRSRIAFILERGTLSRRILRALDGDFSPARLRQIYGQLCTCLESGETFE